MENIIENLKCANIINEEFVHDILRKLFEENGIISLSEEVVYAKEAKNFGELCDFFNLQCKDIIHQDSYNYNEIQLGRTDITIPNIYNKDNNEGSDIIIEIKNVTSWTNAIKLLIYKQRKNDLPIALFFSKNIKKPIPHNKKYVIHNTLNKFNIIVMFFDELIIDIKNFRNRFIELIEFNLKNISSDFKKIVLENIESIRATNFNFKNNNINKQLELYEKSLFFIEMFESDKCNDIKSYANNVKCMNAYAALSTYYGKITILKDAIKMKADNFNEIIKIAILRSRANILDFILSKYGELRENYVKYCNTLETLKVIEKYHKNIDYDEILNFILYSKEKESLQRCYHIDLICNLLNKTDIKIFKYHYIFNDKNIQEIIIKKRIKIIFDYSELRYYTNFETQPRNEFLNNMKIYNLANVNEFLYETELFRKKLEIEKSKECNSEVISNLLSIPTFIKQTEDYVEICDEIENIDKNAYTKHKFLLIKAYFDCEEYNKIGSICEKNKNLLDKIFIEFIERQRFNFRLTSKECLSESILLFNITYINYILERYKKYLNFQYICNEICNRGYLLLLPKLISEGNINPIEIYNKLNFDEYKEKFKYKNENKMCISIKRLIVKYAYNELYRFIITICNLNPNEVATKAVKANNSFVLKLALDEGANNIKELLKKCKRRGKIYYMLKKCL